MKSILSLIIILASVFSIYGQEEILPIWPEGKMPNFIPSNETEVRTQDRIIRIQKVQIPDINVFLPEKTKANKKAVIICPGGGYGMLAYDWEGTDIAKWFTTKGIAAFVLKYRLPGSASVKTRHLAPLQDVQRALRLVRSKADQWNIDPNQIGIIGFSAGGHLAASSGTLSDLKTYQAIDTVDTVSCKPSFMALIYPVVTMKKKYTHEGSRFNLLGKNPKQELIDQFSIETQVNTTTPPTFIVHATNDKAVPVENSTQLYEALQQHNIPSEIKIYAKGGHGFSLARKNKKLRQWTDQLYLWINKLK